MRRLLLRVRRERKAERSRARRSARRRAQIMRGFDQVTRNVLERSVDRQKSEWRVDVSQRQHDCKWAVQKEIQRMLRSDAHIAAAC